MRTNLRTSASAFGLLSVLVLLSGCPKDPPTAGDLGADGGSANVAGQNGGAGTGTGASGTGSMTTKDGGAANGGAGATETDAGGAVVTKDAGVTGGGEVVCSTPCEAYQHCELVQVQCITTPCPPLPQCVDNPSCGGFAGFPCKGQAVCEDDPRDDCDPNKGGADCGGLCVCPAVAKCEAGSVWDAAACECVPSASDAGAAPGDGVVCGKSICAKGEVCCNASCGICTPPDGACIQLFCQ